jgi:hypothetical protein
MFSFLNVCPIHQCSHTTKQYQQGAELSSIPLLFITDSRSSRLFTKHFYSVLTQIYLAFIANKGLSIVNTMDNRRPRSASSTSPSEADTPTDNTKENRTSNSTDSCSGLNRQNLNGTAASFIPSFNPTASYTSSSNPTVVSPTAISFQLAPPAYSTGPVIGSAEPDIDTLRIWSQKASESAQVSSSRNTAAPPTQRDFQASSNANRRRVKLWSVHDVLNCHISYCRPQAAKFEQRTQELNASIKACTNPYADIELASTFLQRRRDLVGAFGRIGLLSEWQIQQALLRHDVDAVSAQLDSIDAENDRLQWAGLRLDNEIHRSLRRRPQAPVCGALYTQPAIGTTGVYASNGKGKQPADFATSEAFRHLESEEQLLPGIGAQFTRDAQRGTHESQYKCPGVQRAIIANPHTNPGRQSQQQLPC